MGSSVVPLSSETVTIGETYEKNNHLKGLEIVLGRSYS